MISCSKLASNSAIAQPFKNFAKFAIENQKSLSPAEFADSLGEIQKVYMKTPEHRDVFYSEAEALVNKLTKSQNLNFASILVSKLCKLTEFIPEKLETFALKGYKIAAKKHDAIHMMSRLNDLRKLYYGRPDKLQEYLSVLFKQENCLKYLTRNYNKATRDYHSLIRKPASKKEYQQMLAHIQVEIAKLTKRQTPGKAIERLISARKLFDKAGNQRHHDYIHLLINESKEIILRNLP